MKSSIRKVHLGMRAVLLGTLVLGAPLIVRPAPGAGPQATVSSQPASRPGAKVLLIYDMEGVSGTATRRDVQFGTDSYPGARESLTEDVNAAVRGLLRGGASEVVVTDGHGSGNPAPDYLVERLPSGARFDVRVQPYDPYIDGIDASFSGVAAIGMHGGADGRAFLAHTYYAHTKWMIGTQSVNESAIVAASAARFDIPLILVSGDDVLKEEVSASLPATEFVIVKRAVNGNRAEGRNRGEVSREIEAAAERAWRRRREIPPWKPDVLQRPFDNRFGYLLPEMAALAMNYPHTSALDDKTVVVRTPTFLDAYLAFRALANFTALVPSRLLVDLARQLEGGPDLLRRAQAQGARPGQIGFTPTSPEMDLKWSAMGRHGYR